MAAPAVGEVWVASMGSLTGTNEDGIRYYVESIVTRGTDDWCHIRQVNPGSAGFLRWVRSAVMENSPAWALDSSPIG